MDPVFEKLNKLKDEQKTIPINFANIDFDTQLVKGRYNGVNVVLPLKYIIHDINRLNITKDRYKIARFLDSPIDVKIEDINEDQNIALCTATPAKEANTRKIDAEIQKALNNGESYKCKVRVYYIGGEGTNSCALCTIVGTNIRCTLWCSAWSTEYTNDIRDYVKVNDSFEVLITDINRSNVMASYTCSRAALLPDPWPGIDKCFSPGDFCNVRVLKVLKNKYLGTINGFPDIPVHLRRSSTSSNYLAIVPGGTYKCIISNVNVEKKKFTAVPYSVVSSNVTPDEPQ